MVVSGLSFLFLSSSSFLLGRSQGKRHRSNITQQLLTVCIRHDDVWALPPKLQGHPLEVTLSCSLLDQVSNLQGEQSSCWNVGMNSHISRTALGLHLSEVFMLIPSLAGL